jgi:hypothetical protein
MWSRSEQVDRQLLSSASVSVSVSVSVSPAASPLAASFVHAGIRISAFAFVSIAHGPAAHPAGTCAGMHRTSYEPYSLLWVPRQASKSGTCRYAGGTEPLSLPPTVPSLLSPESL